MSGSDSVLRIAALGDVMLDRSVGERLTANRQDFACEPLRKLLSQCDLVFANLETTVSTRGTRFPRQDPNVAFRSHPDTLSFLNDLGVGVVSVANNHICDYGDEALVDTLRHLDDAGIASCGAGVSPEAAAEPATLEVAGRPVSVLSRVFIYSASTRGAGAGRPGVADHRIEPLLARITALRGQGHIVLTSVHWGIEYGFDPIPHQRDQARRMLEAGASVVLGHGPHYPQAIERFGAAEIVHSLGNFVFDEPHEWANKTFVYTATLARDDGRVLESQIHPVRIVDGVPTLCEGQEAEEIAARIDALSRSVASRSPAELQATNNVYFRDIVSRVLRMRSLKFATLPPLSFYSDIGWLNLLRKLRPSNLLRSLESWRRPKWNE